MASKRQIFSKPGLAGLGTTGSILAAVAAAAVIVAGLVAFEGWPGNPGGSDDGSAVRLDGTPLSVSTSAGPGSLAGLPGLSLGGFGVAGIVVLRGLDGSTPGSRRSPARRGPSQAASASPGGAPGPGTGSGSVEDALADGVQTAGSQAGGTADATGAAAGDAADQVTPGAGDPIRQAGADSGDVLRRSGDTAADYLRNVPPPLPPGTAPLTIPPR